jgi:hypothetical protein
MANRRPSLAAFTGGNAALENIWVYIADFSRYLREKDEIQNIKY